MYKGLWKRIDKGATGASVHNLMTFAFPVTPSLLEISCELNIIHLERTPVWKMKISQMILLNSLLGNSNRRDLHVLLFRFSASHYPTTHWREGSTAWLFANALVYLAKHSNKPQDNIHTEDSVTLSLHSLSLLKLATLRKRLSVMTGWKHIWQLHSDLQTVLVEKKKQRNRIRISLGFSNHFFFNFEGFMTTFKTFKKEKSSHPQYQSLMKSC